MIFKNRFKLYKAKKQWLIGCATIMVGLSTEMVTNVHADDTAAVAPSGTEQVQQRRVQQSNTSNVLLVAPSQSQSPSTSAQPANSPAKKMSDSSANTPKQQPTQALNESASDEIDMSKAKFQVSMRITLKPDLVYDVVYIPRSPEDLYFGNDQAQPIPSPKNVGVYKIWLTKTGYDNFIAGRNFYVKTNGGKWIYYPIWDVMPNIDIGVYNPINYGHGTYTILPYNIKATITGNQKLTDKNTVIDPSQYQINFERGVSTDKPFDQVSHNFKYHFQAGDLAIDPTSKDGNSYNVILTNQGRTNITTGLTGAFNNYAPNYNLRIVPQAIINVVNDHKNITRTIIIHNPDGSQNKYPQVATVQTKYQLNDQHDGVTFEWQTSEWSKFVVPALEGYKATMAVVPVQSVTVNTEDQTVDIYYIASEQVLTVNFVDDDRNQQLVKKQSIDGKTGESIIIHLADSKLNESTLVIPRGYQLAPNQASELNYVFNGDSNEITVHLIHQHHVADENHIVTRTIKIVNPMTGEVKEHLQKVVFSRSVDTDLVTGKQIFGQWQPLSGQWNQFQAPDFAGYHPSQSYVEQISVTPKTQNQTVIITYTKITTPQPGHRYPTNNHGQIVGPNGTVYPSGSYKGSYGIIYGPDSQILYQPGQNSKLPQTSNENNRYDEALAGLLMLGLTGMLGLGSLKKKNR